MIKFSEHSLVAGLSFLMLIAGIFMLSSNLSQTADDSKEIGSYLDRAKHGQVLGASTEKKLELYSCPDSKPIIGWIDYTGNKLIKQNLDPDQKASSCFTNTEEANKAGFNYKE